MVRIRKKYTPVPIIDTWIKQIDVIAEKSDISRTKLVNLIIEQFITEPQLRRPVIYRATLPMTEWGDPVPLGSNLVPSGVPIEPMTRERQAELKADQDEGFRELDEEMAQAGYEIREDFIDIYPESPININPSIEVRHYREPAAYEYMQHLTKKGHFSASYKEAVRQLYGDPDLMLTGFPTAKERKKHVEDHLVSLILRGLIENSRPTAEEVERKKPQEEWQRYFKNGDFTDEYTDAMLGKFRKDGADTDAKTLSKVMDKPAHIKHFLPILRREKLL